MRARLSCCAAGEPKKGLNMGQRRFRLDVGNKFHCQSGQSMEYVLAQVQEASETGAVGYWVTGAVLGGTG